MTQQATTIHTIEIGEFEFPVFGQWIPNPDGRGGGHRAPATEKKIGRLTLTIDVSKLPIHKKIQALTSKGKKTTMQQGAIVLKASNVRVEKIAPA